jgi:hypothetical protein
MIRLPSPRCGSAARERRVADIFVSYTSQDKLWAFWIDQELEALGHVPHIHDWKISFGEDIAAWMEERHHKADHILCVSGLRQSRSMFWTMPTMRRPIIITG